MKGAWVAPCLVFLTFCVLSCLGGISSSDVGSKQAHDWLVYRLWPGQGEGDDSTRLMLNLSKALEPKKPFTLDTFTLCVWLKVQAYLSVGTLLSYDLPNELFDAIRFRVNPTGNYLRIVYVEHKISIPLSDSPFLPLDWHTICLVKRQLTLEVWVDGDAVHSVNTTSSLPLTGILILGQDQDGLDEGYTKDQSFLGEVTGLTLWQEDLGAQALHAWGACDLPDVLPLFPWNSVDWFVYNYTGAISSHQDGPCGGAKKRNKTAVFSLRGLTREVAGTVNEGEDLNFVLASDHASGVYFHGLQQFHIKKHFNSSRWCLGGAETNQVACVTSVIPPIGRHDWIFRDDDESQSSSIPLSLSRCSYREFPCSDGSCIDLDKLCNRVTDCHDRSDEVGCATALLPSDYLEDILPAIPLPLYAEISLLKLTTFDILSMTFLAHLEIKLSWSDPQVTFAHLLPGISKEVVTNSQKNVWTPSVTVASSTQFHSEADSRLEVIAIGPRKLTSEGYHFDGLVNPLVQTLTVSSTINCHFQLHWYPWDTQNCHIDIKVANVGEDGLLVNKSSRVSECPKMLEEYYVEECRLKHPDSRTNMLSVQLKLKRRYEHHFFTKFLPTSLLLILGYGTLLLPIEYYNERGTMSLTTLLVFISLYTETSGSLPSTAYLKLIDVWFVFSITFLTLIICVHLATFTIGPKVSHSNNPQTDSNTKPPAGQNTVFTIKPKSAFTNEPPIRYPPGPKTAFTSNTGPLGIGPLDTHITGLQSRLHSQWRSPSYIVGSCPTCLPTNTCTWTSTTRAESLLKASRVILAATLILDGSPLTSGNCNPEEDKLWRWACGEAVSSTTQQTKMVCEGALRVTGLVLVVVLVMVQLGAGQHAFVSTACTEGGCGSGAAQSISTDEYGVTTGECAYLNAQGQSVKIKFRETPDGQVEAASDQGLSQDPRAELRACREAVKAVSQNVQQDILHAQNQVFRQQQRLQEDLFRQQQAIFGQQRFHFPPVFGFPNRFPFNNFR
ncbi:hypothetical protein Pcinc_003422 [Petrolisthes cinctipes]|uniref:Pentraxin (PTX) domain-containing protein n=1 Tax=Petrolisthes cinctipes TaxID=88211 RepID=A0AAE1L2I0_PETCI|nr:hypothetical protein Pcinc_003422 [Petrolisthes cinctipes]